jgi:hypothetical protein
MAAESSRVAQRCRLDADTATVRAVSTPAAFQGRVTRKKSNALHMDFGAADDAHGPADAGRAPFATAEQGGGDGRGAKLGVLFGFKNGGPGTHRVTFEDGYVLDVASRESKPTVFSDSGGTPVASAERGESTTVSAPDGAPILRVVPRVADGVTADLLHMALTTPLGAELGTLDVVRTQAGWRTLDDLLFDPAWMNVNTLKTPILGTSVRLHAVPDVQLARLLVGICVDIAIGLRPYIS